MIRVDEDLCNRCGVCITRFGGYCISDHEGRPEIDREICNQCQKCIAICPHQAIFMNGRPPIKIGAPIKLRPEDLKELLQKRRSCKKFKGDRVPREILLEVARIAALAPNQNKNIDIIIVDDPELIAAINRMALKAARKLYRLLFSFQWLTGFYQLFSKELAVIRRKMEWDLSMNRCIVKENTPSLILLTGNPAVPVTEISAQYLLATMSIYAEAFNLGTCVMDSLKLFINGSKSMKKQLGFPKGIKVLGVLATGYSNERIVNIPQGYEMKIDWNKRMG